VIEIILCRRKKWIDLKTARLRIPDHFVSSQGSYGEQFLISEKINPISRRRTYPVAAANAQADLLKNDILNFSRYTGYTLKMM